MVIRLHTLVIWKVTRSQGEILAKKCRYKSKDFLVKLTSAFLDILS